MTLKSLAIDKILGYSLISTLSTAPDQTGTVLSGQMGKCKNRLFLSAAHEADCLQLLLAVTGLLYEEYLPLLVYCLSSRVRNVLKVYKNKLPTKTNFFSYENEISWI